MKALTLHRPWDQAIVRGIKAHSDAPGEPQADPLSEHDDGDDGQENPRKTTARIPLGEQTRPRLRIGARVYGEKAISGEGLALVIDFTGGEP